MNSAVDFNSDMMPLLVAGAVFLTLLFVALGVGQALSARRSGMKQQIKAMEARWRADLQAAMPTEKIDSNADQSRLDRTMGRWMPRRQALEQRIERAGLNIGMAHYAVICIVVTLVVVVVAMLLLRRPPLIAVPLGIAVGVGFPHWLLGVLGARRIAKFLSLFPEAIDLIVRGLKSGLPIQESIATVAQEIPDPVGIEFRRINDAVKVGRPLEDALWSCAGRIDSPDFKFFVISLSVQRETGGNLAEALQNLSDILRRRRQMRLKVRAMSSEARASAYIIGSLPFVMFGILMLVNSKYVLQLFNDPRGLTMVSIGLTSMAIGIFIMFKMVKFEI